MKSYLPITAIVLLLSACETNQQDAQTIKSQARADAAVLGDKAERSSMRVANTFRDNVKRTGMQIRKWWLTPLPSNEPTPVPPSYCYKVLQDINCYRAPLPGETYRIVGYQGDGVLAPETAQTRPLAASRIPKLGPPITGAERVANAKPVFVAIPTQVKEDKTELKDGMPAMGSEPLPDPTLAPQL